MSLAEHDDMIKTFAPDRTDQPFSMSILPWRSRRRWPVTYAPRANASGKRRDAIKLGLERLGSRSCHRLA
jgi:hypothetical protein